MSGQKEPKAKYRFNWAVGAAPSGDQAAEFQMEVTPVGWVSDEQAVEVPVEETVAVMMNAEAEPSQGVSVAPLSDEGYLDSFRSSPKSKRGLDRTGGLLSNKVRTLSVVGWSGIAAVGAVLALLSPGSIEPNRIAELGGVWAVVAAALWLLTSRI